MAAMSGSCGPWPSSPVANPSHPAASAKTSSRWFAGPSFAFALPYISTNCAKMNSIPILSTSLRTSSTDCGTSAIVRPFRSSGSPHPSEVTHLRCPGEREPVFPVEIQTRDLLDPAQPLAKRVRVDEQGARAPDDVASMVEVALERVEQLRAAPAIVRHEQLELLLQLIAAGLLGAHDVLVRAQVVVGRHAGLPPDEGAHLGGGGGFGESAGERQGTLARVRQPHRERVMSLGGPPAHLSDGRDRVVDRAVADRDHRPNRPLQPVGEQAGGPRGESSLDLPRQVL